MTDPSLEQTGSPSTAGSGWKRHFTSARLRFLRFVIGRHRQGNSHHTHTTPSLFARRMHLILSSKALLVLTLLTFQNCAVALFLRYVRTRTSHPQASIGCVVILQELTKFLLSCVWCAYDAWVAASTATPSNTEDHDRHHLPGGGTAGSESAQPREAGDLPNFVNIKDVSQPEASDKGHGIVQGNGSGPGWRNVSLPWQSVPCSAIWACMKHQVFNRQGLKLLIPAALFSLQNALLFVAMSNLEPTMFLVLYQSKLLTTGVLMVLLLGRSFSRQKWLAMSILLCGIVLTQRNPNASLRPEKGEEDATIGVGAVLICALSSSIAGVLMEKFMKDTTDATHLSTKNIHLSFFSMILVATPVVFRAWSAVEEYRGFFYGIDGIVWAMILNQALGGILVALTLRYADNILKGFATTCAIVVGGVISHFLFGFVPSGYFIAGSMTVGCAILLYALPDYC